MRICTILILTFSFSNFAYAKDAHLQNKQFWTCVRSLYSDIKDVKNKVRLSCQDPASEACSLARADYEIAKAGIAAELEECKSAQPQEGAQ